MFPHIDRQLLRHRDHLVGEVCDHIFELFFLERGQAFLDPALKLIRGIGIGAVEIKWQWRGIPILQARSPACGDNEGRAHTLLEQVGMAANLGALLPFKGSLVFQLTNELKTGGGMIAILEQGRDIARFAIPESMSEDESENRRESEQKNENPPVTIDMDEFLDGDAADRLK